jgi:hypothetical protein
VLVGDPAGSRGEASDHIGRVQRRGDVVERLLAPVLELDIEHGGAGEPAVVSARRAAGPDGDEAAVLAWLVTHPGAALGNAWREALLRVAGHQLTKNEARAIVRGSGLPAGLLGLRLADLPRDALAAVPGTVREITAARSTEDGQPSLLGGLLSGTAVLAPAYQMHLHTGTSLHKHVGFGLLFAAPMAGVAMSRLVGAHFRRPELAIVAWVTLLVLGLTQSQDRYHVWPDTTRLIAALGPHLGPDSHYLVGANWVPQYSLRTRSRPDQWTSTYFIAYTDRRGRRLSGDAGYRAAVEDGYFDVVVLDPLGGRVDRTLARQLRGDAGYRLLAALPYRRSTGSAFYRVRYVPGTYQIWVRAAR